MKRSIWRGILLKALDIAKPGKEYKRGILEGFRESYKVYEIDEMANVKIGFIKRRRMRRKAINNIILARRSILHNEEEDAGKYLGSAILQIFYISISERMRKENIDKILKGLGSVRLENIEAIQFINSLGKRLDELNKVSPVDSIKGLVMIISLLIKFVKEKKKLEEHALDKYKKAEKIHMLIYFPTAILVAILIIYLAFILLLPLLAFVSVPVAPLIIQLDRKYFRLKRMLKWNGINI